MMIDLFKSGSGAQPIVSEDEKLILCVNGEIYNHKQLRNELKEDYDFKTESDCEVILHAVSGLCFKKDELTDDGLVQRIR